MGRRRGVEGTKGLHGSVGGREEERPEQSRLLRRSSGRGWGQRGLFGPLFDFPESCGGFREPEGMGSPGTGLRAAQ